MVTTTDTRTPIRIPISRRTFLDADLTLPAHADALVLFAHGTGSSRLSPRNQYVARQLNDQNLATLLADLLTEDEADVDERSGVYRFDIATLTRRVIALCDWLYAFGPVPALPIGLFGASTGAAAALSAAAARPELVRAVVSRGGRPDLSAHLADILAPTLLIVGGKDAAVLNLNREALQKLQCQRELLVVPGASHLFEEPGTLEAVASAAGAWFHRHLSTQKKEAPMLIREIMTTNPALCTPAKRLDEVALLMREYDCGEIPVCDDGKVIGVVTDRDIVLRCVAAGKTPAAIPASEIMTKDVYVVREDDKLETALEMMEKKLVRRLPVIDSNGRIVGIVSQADLIARAPTLKVARALKSVAKQTRLRPISAL